MVSLKSARRLGFHFLLPFFISICLTTTSVMATSCTSEQQCENTTACQTLAKEVVATYGGKETFICHINQCQAGSSTVGMFFNC